MSFRISAKREVITDICISGASPQFLAELHLSLARRLCDMSTAVSDDVKSQMEELKNHVWALM